MKSILKYIGMKEVNLQEFGFKNETIYCEPFSGSFNNGLKMYENGFRDKLIYNDLDEQVTNFWVCVKENNVELLNRINQLNNILKNYFTDSERNNTLERWLKSTNNIKRAAAEFIYRQYLTIDGLKWNIKDNITDSFDFYLHEEAFKHIEINNIDYKDIILKYDSENTFFFIDPPYDIARASKYYRGNDKGFNHSELANIIKNLKGNWLLTYNDNYNIRELYKDYKIKKHTRKLFGKDYTELYITKY